MGDVIRSVLGIVPLIAVGYLLSVHRKKIKWRPVIGGLVLQIIFAALILKTHVGFVVFRWAGDVVTIFLNFSDEGAKFLFGSGFMEHFFAFKVLPTIIFFSSVMAIAYHLGVMQWVVKLFAKIMEKTMGTSGAESLSAAANIFVGQTEAPLMIRPFVEKMTKSELMAIMTGGFATIAGGVLAAYISFGVDAAHLLAASVMSAPAALAFSKLMFPETEVSQTMGEVKVEIEDRAVNMIDAATKGAGEGLKLALNVGAMLMAFIALIAVVNAMMAYLGGFIGMPTLSLEYLLGILGWPFAYFIGVPFEDCAAVGSLIGQKIVINEFIAYQALGQAITENLLSDRGEYLATYALCGFANFSSIAIQIGGIGGMAPSRKGDLAKIGLRAMIAGNLACFMTANIAGMMLPS